MALNPIVYTEKVVRSFLRYQLTAHPFADERLHGHPLLHDPFGRFRRTCAAACRWPRAREPARSR